MNIDVRRVVIRGGARGIGVAAARQLANYGWRIELAHIDAGLLTVRAGEWDSFHTLFCHVIKQTILEALADFDWRALSGRGFNVC